MSKFNTFKFGIISADTSSVSVGDKKNCDNEFSESLAFVPFDFDCSIPYPPYIEGDQLSYGENVEVPFKAAFADPIPIFHKLPDSTIEDLHR